MFPHRMGDRASYRYDDNGELVSWCFKPSQPQRITSGLMMVMVIMMVVVMIMMMMMSENRLKLNDK